MAETKLLRTPEGGAPGTAHEGRGENRELNDVLLQWKRVNLIYVWYHRVIIVSIKPNQFIDALTH